MQKIGKRAVRKINERQTILKERVAKAESQGKSAGEETIQRLKEVEYLIAVIGISAETSSTTKQN